MNTQQTYAVWIIGGIIILGVVVWGATYAAGLSTSAATTPTSATSTSGTAQDSASPHASASAGPDSNIGGITNPGAATSSAPYQTVLLQLGTTLNTNGVQATPESVVEDSRCPADVQCIQAGTVEVSVKFVFDGYAVTRTFTLGKPQTAYDYTVELTDARPAKQSGVTINPTDYRFVFTIAKP